MSNAAQGRGRPVKYRTEDERKAARAAAARQRRAKATPAKQGRGRPIKYQSDEERKSVRAAEARARRAALKEQGLKEIRRMVKIKQEKRPQSTILDLSMLYNNKRKEK